MQKTRPLWRQAAMVPTAKSVRVTGDRSVCLAIGSSQIACQVSRERAGRPRLALMVGFPDLPPQC